MDNHGDGTILHDGGELYENLFHVNGTLAKKRTKKNSEFLDAGANFFLIPDAFFNFKGYPKPHLYNFLRNTASEQDLSEYGALICMSRERGKRTIM